MTTATANRTGKANPASAGNANGECEKKLTCNHSSTLEDTFQALTHCSVCKDQVAWADVHISGLCWRCQQDKDYFADQDEYMAMAHGLV